MHAIATTDWAGSRPGERSDDPPPRRGDDARGEPLHRLAGVEELTWTRRIRVFVAEGTQRLRIGDARFRRCLHLDRHEASLRREDEIHLFSVRSPPIRNFGLIGLPFSPSHEVHENDVLQYRSPRFLTAFEIGLHVSREPDVTLILRVELERRRRIPTSPAKGTPVFM